MTYTTHHISLLSNEVGHSTDVFGVFQQFFLRGSVAVSPILLPRSPQKELPNYTQMHRVGLNRLENK